MPKDIAVTFKPDDMILIRITIKTIQVIFKLDKNRKDPSMLLKL